MSGEYEELELEKTSEISDDPVSEAVTVIQVDDPFAAITANAEGGLRPGVVVIRAPQVASATLELVDQSRPLFTLNESGEIVLSDSVLSDLIQCKRHQATFDTQLFKNFTTDNLKAYLKDKSVDLLFLFNGYRPANYDGSVPYSDTNTGNYVREKLVLGYAILPGDEGFSCRLKILSSASQSEKLNVKLFGFNGSSAKEYLLSIEQNFDLLDGLQKLVLEVEYRVVRFQNDQGDVCWYKEIEQIFPVVNLVESREIRSKTISASEIAEEKGKDRHSIDINNPSTSSARQHLISHKNNEVYSIVVEAALGSQDAKLKAVGELKVEDSMTFDYNIPPGKKYLFSNRPDILFHNWFSVVD